MLLDFILKHNSHFLTAHYIFALNLNCQKHILSSFYTHPKAFKPVLLQSVPILENKGMGAISQKMGREMLKKGKIFGNLGKNVQSLKML